MLLCIGLTPEVAFACSCISPTLSSRYEGSDNVFTALITGGEASGERVGNSLEFKTYFEVTETFKGTIPFAHFSSHAGGSSCGISLQVGVEYLIFAPDAGRIGLCSGIVAISGVPQQGEAIGQKYLAALRAFKSGQHASLAEPWIFNEHQGICTLSARFPYGETGWPASIRVTYWARVPKSVTSSPGKPDVKAGFTEMAIWVPGREDLTDYPLTLIVGDKRFLARWSKDEHSRPRYLVSIDYVPSLVAELAPASSLRLQSSHPTHGEIDTEAPMTNAGDSVTKLMNCMQAE